MTAVTTRRPAASLVVAAAADDDDDDDVGNDSGSWMYHTVDMYHMDAVSTPSLRLKDNIL